MAIHINGRFLVQSVSGIQRYARELLSALDVRLSEEPELARRLGPITVWYPAAAKLVDPPDWQVLRITPLAGFSGHAWEQITLGRRTAGHGVLVSLCGAGPLITARQFLVIHDANIWTFPKAFSKPYRFFHKVMRPLLVRRVSHVGTVSKFSAKELAGYLRIPAERFIVIPNSAEHILSARSDDEALVRYGLKSQQYFFAAGNQSPNKNIARLVAAIERLDDNSLPLAVAGGLATGVAQSKIGETACVRLLGRVSDAELRTLYANAAAFVWPSLYEGFGIPPLEAMALGTPVLSSDTTAMPEVLGDAVTYFTPTDVDSIAAALRNFQALPPAARDEMGAACKTRAAQFSWRRSADALIDILIRSDDKSCFQSW